MPDSASKTTALRSFTDWSRQAFQFIVDPIARLLAHSGIHPNVLTFSGLAGNAIGAVLLARGDFVWGGILILLMGPIDALDGATARARGKPSPWGAFVDSTTDRWSESVIMLGLLIHYANRAATQEVVLVLFAIVGSLMVSYTRARAESLGFSASVGVLTRLERYLVLAPALVFRHPEIALWIIAPLANITAVQRTLHVRRQWYVRDVGKPETKGSKRPADDC
jgi:CDP-diacylglycerol--glycerol-3-phosphate 3-phosphatidyltransferase